MQRRYQQNDESAVDNLANLLENLEAKSDAAASSCFNR